MRMVFEFGRDRIATMFGLQFIGNTSNRPGSVLARCYEDFKVVIVRDPGNQNKETIVIHARDGKTKGYLGAKDAYVSSISRW